METLFWLSLGLIVYTHVGYPLVLIAMGRLAHRPIKRGPAEPSVSVIIAAHNEEAIIERKLANTLALEYPQGERQIILVSDGSTDATDAIAQALAPAGVTCIRLEQRCGKSAALNCGMAAASGEVLVFTDAAAVANADCLRQIMAHFSDPQIGCVSTNDTIDEPGGSSGEGGYVRYEMEIRRLESEIGSCAAVSGSFYAVRRQICRPFPPAAATDLMSVLDSVRQGFRVISEPNARVSMGTVARPGPQFERKVRTVLTGLACLPAMMPLLNPLRYKLFSWELFSHKILRWLSGPLIACLFISSILLAGESAVFQVAVGVQVAGYLVTLAGACRPRLLKRSALFRLPYVFLSGSVSTAVAWWRYVRGVRMPVWEPSNRRAEEAER